MVFSKKIFLLSVFLIQPFIFSRENSCPSANETSFIQEPAPGRTKRQSLSKARRQAVEALESMAHELTAQTALAAQALDDILWNIRDIAESNDDSAFMTGFLKERDKTLTALKRVEKDLQERTVSLRTLNKTLKPEVIKTTVLIKK